MINNHGGASGWWVYMLRCGDGSLYTGATTDLAARIDAHNRGRGARYTRSRLPVAVVWTRRMRGKVAALRLEYRIKQLTRAEKLALVDSVISKKRRLNLSAPSDRYSTSLKMKVK